jgi:tryptophan synthase alpha chain
VNRLASTLVAKRASGAKLLIPYVMGAMTRDWIDGVAELVSAGADAVEVGLPFSDPMMDGPVIQQAAGVALARGATPQEVIDDLARVDLGVPIVVMTYYNLVFRAGHRRMAGSLVAAGVGGAIVPDLSLEEIAPWAEAADEAGVETVMMVAPSTPPERVKALCARSRGFVYAVGRMGVTGERTELTDSAARVVDAVRACTDLPVCVGIGISNPDHARTVGALADGVVVGSAVVRRMLENGPEVAGAFVAQMRAALDEVAESTL